MYFLWEQCYSVKVLKVAPDNEPSQLLETRGNSLSMRRTEHIKDK